MILADTVTSSDSVGDEGFMEISVTYGGPPPNTMSSSSRGINL